MRFRLPPPQLQVDFSFALAQIRTLYLQDALLSTVEKVKISSLDKQLTTSVPAKCLSELAGQGLRGELVFPVPVLLEANPRLLGYYRLLNGFSQKAFYTAETGFAGLKGLEENGSLSPHVVPLLPAMCKALVACGRALLSGVGAKRLTKEFLDDLTLLTVGPQLRGGANVKIGTINIAKVFESIFEIVKPAATRSGQTRIEVINAASRRVVIEFASDPDIVIREQMGTGAYRELVAIEVKGGTDFSNIHNRIGEAEKSHQKARNRGYVECWTVVNVDRIDLDMARRESPSTNRFYRISKIIAGKGEEYSDFRNRVVSLTGISDL